MGVLDKLPSGKMNAIIRELGQVSKEMKAPQTIGSSGVLTSSVQSQASYDISIPANDARDVLFQFTPSDVSLGGGLAFRLYYSVNGASYNEVNPSFRQPVGADNIQAWRIPGGNSSSSTASTMKFIIVCIGSGTFSCSLVT